MGLFIDAFTLFPWSLFGYAVPVWELGFKSEFIHVHIHCYKNYYKCNKAAMTMHIDLSHYFNFTREGWSDLFAPNIYVGKSSGFHK
jgi:hypothetical protein